MRVFNLKFLWFYIKKYVEYKLSKQSHHKQVVSAFISSRPEIVEIVGVSFPEFFYEQNKPKELLRMYKINGSLTWFTHEIPDANILMLVKSKQKDFNLFLESLDKLKPQELNGYQILDVPFWGSHYKNFKDLHITKVLRKANSPGDSFYPELTKNNVFESSN